MRILIPLAAGLCCAANATNSTDFYVVGRRLQKQYSTIVTIAGGSEAGFSGDGGPATLAKLNNPFAICLDAASNLIIADTYNGLLRMVSAATQEISTIVSLDASKPKSVAVDTGGSFYVTDNECVLRVDGATHRIETIAGQCSVQGYSGDGGPATNALLCAPYGIAVDRTGTIYIADTYNNAVRSITYPGRVINTFAGGVISQGPTSSSDGILATRAYLGALWSVACDTIGNVYVTDGSRVRLISVGSRVITTVASVAGTALSLVLDSANNLYIGDSSHVVRRLSAASGALTTIAGNGVQGYSGDGGPPTSAALDMPCGIAVDTVHSRVYIIDQTSRVRMLEVSAPTPLPHNTSTITVTPLVVDGDTATDSLGAGTWAYYSFSQPMPYGVLLTLTSISGDADLFIGSTLPTAVNGGFNYSVASDNGDSGVDWVQCLPNGGAVSASHGSTPSACWGPAATSVWYIQISGWTSTTYSLEATSLLSAPAGIGSPQATPNAYAASATLALGVTAIGALTYSGEVTYWTLEIPPPSLSMATAPTSVYLHVSSSSGDVDLLVGTTPPYGTPITFDSTFSSTRVGDDSVMLPAQAFGAYIICVKAFSAPVSFTLIAGTPVTPVSPSPSTEASTPLAAIISPVVIGALLLCAVVLIATRHHRKRKAAKTAALAAAPVVVSVNHRYDVFDGAPGSLPPATQLYQQRSPMPETSMVTNYMFRALPQSPQPTTANVRESAIFGVVNGRRQPHTHVDQLSSVGVVRPPGPPVRPPTQPSTRPVAADAAALPPSTLSRYAEEEICAGEAVPRTVFAPQRPVLSNGPLQVSAPPINPDDALERGRRGSDDPE